MEKIICVNDEHFILFLTEGKIYDLIRIIKIADIAEYYVIVDDNGHTSDYHSDRFRLLSEIRNERLQSIGI